MSICYINGTIHFLNVSLDELPTRHRVAEANRSTTTEAGGATADQLCQMNDYAHGNGHHGTTLRWAHTNATAWNNHQIIHFEPNHLEFYHPGAHFTDTAIAPGEWANSGQYGGEYPQTDAGYAQANHTLHYDAGFYDDHPAATTPTNVWASVSETEPLSSDTLDDLNDMSGDAFVPPNYFDPPLPLWCELSHQRFTDARSLPSADFPSEIAQTSQLCTYSSLDHSSPQFNSATSHHVVPLEN